MIEAKLNPSKPAPLHSELARFCLPASRREANSKLAWTNSICLFFLIIGLLGGKNAPMQIKLPAAREELVATILEPTSPAPTSTSQEPPKDEPTEQDKSAVPQAVVVTLDSPAINFSVPTIGNLVVPNAIAQAPPLNPVRTMAVVRPVPTLLNNTGQGGDRPMPPYPKMALESAQQGTVILKMTADEAGLLVAVEVKETSGYPILDRSSVDYVKKHWTVPPGPAGRIFQATITYKLNLKF